MFGYVIPDKPNMFMKDYTLYRAFYCGFCKSIGKHCSQIMRFTTNYDMTFLNVLYHAIENVDVKIKQETCILNPITKKSIVKDDECTQIIIDINNILGHYKCVDDVIDNKSVSKLLFDKLILNKHYKRAKVNLKKIDEIVKFNYEDLRNLERERCSSMDRISHPFAVIMKEITKELFLDKYTENLGNMMYAIGKWVYLVDAIDDIDEDFKENKYNVFLEKYEYKDKKTFLEQNRGDIEFALMSCYNTISKNFEEIKVEKYEGVLTNILWYGILQKTNEILTRSEKCKKIHI